jgi:hypothetical protein
MKIQISRDGLVTECTFFVHGFQSLSLMHHFGFLELY